MFRALCLLAVSLSGFLFASFAWADNPGSPFGLSDAVYGKVLILVFALNTGLSAVRTILAKIDGIDPGGQIPADQKGLTIVNKLAILAGKALDFIQGNTQH